MEIITILQSVWGLFSYSFKREKITFVDLENVKYLDQF